MAYSSVSNPVTGSDLRIAIDADFADEMVSLVDALERGGGAPTEIIGRSA